MDNDIGKIPPVSSKPKKKDRGAVVVKGREKQKFDFGLLAIVAVTIFVPVATGIYFFSGDESEKVVVEAKPEHQSTEAFLVGSDEPDSSFTLDNLIKGIEDKKAKAEEERRLAEEAKKAAPLPEPVIIKPVQRNVHEPDTLHDQVIVPATNQGHTNQVVTPSASELRKLGGGVMALVDGNDEKRTGFNVGVPAIPSVGGFGGLEQFSNTFDSPKYKEGTASLTSVEKQDFLLRSGTNIPCALITKVVSTYKGLVSCSVISDVYSANGTTLLIEKGSQISGNQSVSLAQGQARLFVTWSNVKTPEGVNVQIDSLGTDALGASGVEAHVDNHFKERFGGAIMLSFIDDAFATLSNKIADSNSDVSTDSTSGAAQDIAGIALENSINIAPTGYVNIGERVNILVARDIDMSNVYEIQPFQ